MKKRPLSYFENCTYDSINSDKNPIDKDDVKAGVIIMSQKHIIVVRGTSSKKYGFPKGSYDTNDKCILDTAIRELYEETGIKISNNQISYGLETFIKFDRNNGKKSMGYFACLIVEVSEDTMNDFITMSHLNKSELIELKKIKCESLNYLCNSTRQCTMVFKVFVKYLFPNRISRQL